MEGRVRGWGGNPGLDPPRGCLKGWHRTFSMSPALVAQVLGELIIRQLCASLNSKPDTQTPWTSRQSCIDSVPPPPESQASGQGCAAVGLLP